MTHDLRIVPPGTFGAACLEALLEAVAGIEHPVVGLPTGNTPIPLYEALNEAVCAGRVSVSGWRPFAIDEYGGPRDHPCSNRSFFARYWDTIPGAVPVEQFDPEAPDVTVDCRRMAEALRAAGGLDVSLLGIGMNGHLAFNEPGSAPTSGPRRVDLHEASRISGAPCWGEATPTWGLTLGMAELLAAKSVIVMANGAAKAPIVARAIDGPETPNCPASLTRSANTTWLLDTPAAGLLAAKEQRNEGS